MDFAPPFNMGHPKAFELAQRLVEITPPGLNKVFYTNSGSESGGDGAEDRDRLPPRVAKARARA